MVSLSRLQERPAVDTLNGTPALPPVSTSPNAHFRDWVWLAINPNSTSNLSVSPPPLSSFSPFKEMVYFGFSFQKIWFMVSWKENDGSKNMVTVIFHVWQAVSCEKGV